MRLPPPGDPLVTTDGKMLEPKARVEPDYTLTVPTARDLVPRKHRSVREMGVDGQTQTVVNAVLVYKLLGVSPNEVAHILGTSPLEIDRIMDLPAFQETFEMMFNEILSVNSSSLQARIGRYAGQAFENLMELANAKPIEIVKEDAEGNKYKGQQFDVSPLVILKANESVLDRSGLSAEHLFGKGAQSETPQLEIEITSASENKADLGIKIKVG